MYIQLDAWVEKNSLIIITLGLIKFQVVLQNFFFFNYFQARTWWLLSLNFFRRGFSKFSESRHIRQSLGQPFPVSHTKGSEPCPCISTARSCIYRRIAYMHTVYRHLPIPKVGLRDYLYPDCRAGNNAAMMVPI